MIPSNFRIEILSIRALLYAIGSKGLRVLILKITYYPRSFLIRQSFLMSRFLRLLKGFISSMTKYVFFLQPSYYTKKSKHMLHFQSFPV